MQIKIGENHRVITDPLNYHSNFKQAIESYVGKGLKLSDAKGVEGILNKLEQLEEDIQNLEVE